MQIKNTLERYGLVAMLFHWVMALALIVMLVVGFSMTSLPNGPQKFSLYGLHKATGIVLLALVTLRLLWRMANPAPALPATLPVWQRHAANASHFVLYVICLTMPLTGWMMSSAAGFSVSVFGLFVLPDFIAPNPGMRELFGEAHEILAFTLIAVVVVHALAALKHHFVDRDAVLRRMLP